MPSLSDDLSGNGTKSIADLIKDLLSKKKKEKKEKNKKSLKAATKKGLFVTWNTAKFSANEAMKALTGDNIKYSNNIISPKELQKKGKVERIDATVTKEVLEDLDQVAKKLHLKYSVMQATENGSNEKQFYILFHSSDVALVNTCIDEAMKRWNERNQEKTQTKGKEKERGKEPARESVKEKLKFFRKMAENRNSKQKVNEKESFLYTLNRSID